MRCLLILFLSLCLHSFADAQKNDTEKNFQIKLELLDVVNSFPRIGVGLGTYFSKFNIWSTVHYGWDGIATRYVNTHFDGHYVYYGFRAGINKVKYAGAGHYLLGIQIAYDNTSATPNDDVFYDRNQNTAVLFDTATFHRSRTGIFLHTGYELAIGRLFTIEFSTGAGVRHVKNYYDDIINPLELADVPPLKVRKRTLYKYAGTSWKPALIGSVKLGIRL